MSRATPMHLYCFDFDGVVVNSANETGETAWRAAHGLWPEDIAPLPSEAYRERFPALRPVIETGYENVPLVRLFVDGVPDAEIIEHFPRLSTELIAAQQLNHGDLRRRFGAARDAWMADDLDAWLAAQSFYPGVVEAINRLADRDQPRCIITTKEDRFTRQLVADAGVHVEADRVYALEAFEGAGKRGALDKLAQEFPGATLHFFEDRYKTLDKLRDVPNLRRYLVDWGYNTSAERALAASDADVELVGPDRFAEVVG